MAPLPRTRLPRPVLTRSEEPETTPPRVRETVGTTTLMAWATSGSSVTRPLSATLLKPPKVKSPWMRTALLIALAEAPESSRAPLPRMSRPAPTGPAVGVVPTELTFVLVLRNRPEPPVTVKSLVKTLWPPRESTPPPVTAMGIWISSVGLKLASSDEMLRVGCHGAKFWPSAARAIGATLMVAVLEPPRSSVPPAPPVIVAMAEGFWLVATRVSVSVRVPVPTLTVAPTGATASCETLPPLLLIVRPARVLLPARVKVDSALRMTRLAGLILPAAVVRLARLRVTVEFAVRLKPWIGVVRALLRVRTWFSGSVLASIAVMVVPPGMPTPETNWPTRKAEAFATVTVLSPWLPLSVSVGLMSACCVGPAGTTKPVTSARTTLP